jgi:hypothetical protein
MRGSLEKIQRALRPEHVHVLGDSKSTIIAGSLPSGHIYRCKIEGVEKNINCAVNLDVLLSMVPVKGTLNMEERGGVLSVSCGRSKGQVPHVVGSLPDMPKPTAKPKSILSAEDAEWLSDVLPYISLTKTEASGSTSIEGVDGQLRACTYDDIHGAFAYRDSKCEVRMGLTPKDSTILVGMLALGTQVSFENTDDNRLIVTRENDRLVLPCIEPSSQDKASVYGKTEKRWRIKGVDLAETVNGIGAVAGAKEAGPVVFSCVNNVLKIGASSTAGKLSRELEAKTTDHAVRFGCNYTLLNDLSARMSKEKRIDVWLEPGTKPTTRVVFVTANASYVMLTSGE